MDILTDIVAISAICLLLGVILGHLLSPEGIEGRLSNRQVVGIIHNRHRFRLMEIREKFNKLHPLDTPSDLLKEQADEAEENKKFEKFEKAMNEYFGR